MTIDIKTLAGSDQNFCRVFELPITYPSGYCFGGGHPVTFQMVDWFNPLPFHGEPSFESWEACRDDIKQFIREKNYIRPGRTYLVITDFGESFLC